MAATAPQHDYHLVNPSPWPAVGATSAFVLAVGAIMYMRHVTPWVLLIGAVGVLYTMYAWWSDVIKEAKSNDVCSFPQIVCCASVLVARGRVTRRVIVRDGESPTVMAKHSVEDLADW